MSRPLSRFTRVVAISAVAGAMALSTSIAADASTREFPQLYFKSCAQAKALGYSNILRGQPGYRPGLDRDNDGVACEGAPKPEGRVFGVDGQGRLQLFTGTLAGMRHAGQRGTGWQAMSYLAQINHTVGDGNRDLLARRGTDNSLWLYPVTASGYPQTPVRAGNNWGGMDQIVPVHNLTGGSTQYVVARRAKDGALFRYTLTSKGLTGTTQIGQNWGSMRQIVGAGDFTCDGRADVLGIRSDGTLWVYQGTAKGTIGAGKRIGQGWGNFTRALVPDDLTRDGKLDLVGQRKDGIVFGYQNRVGSWGVATKILTNTGSYRLLA